MKIKTVLVAVIVLLLVVCLIAVSFMAGIGYDRMQARNAQIEFSRDRGGQPAVQGQGVRNGGFLQMIHDMVGISMPGQ